MVINHTRFKDCGRCWRYVLNTYHRNLTSPAKSMNLIDGGAFHAAVAVGMGSKNWASAEAAARDLFDKEIDTSNIPPEQDYLRESHWELIKSMLELYRENFSQEDYMVLQPECEFDVTLPGEESWHSCIWMHWYDKEDRCEKWGPPEVDKILRGSVTSPHFNSLLRDYKARMQCKCWQPHRLVGKTDAIVSWKNNIWLLEHKTSSEHENSFWDPYILDTQCTAYIYGIWRSLNIRPRGVIVNRIFKPSENQVAAWNSKRKSGPNKSEKDYLNFSRQAFLRTEEDLYRFERSVVDTCNEWEQRIISGKFPLEINRGSCFNYNRRCYYLSACAAHDAPNEFEVFASSRKDYVDVKLEEVMTQYKIERKETL